MPENSRTETLMFRRQATITFVDGMLSHVDAKCLSEMLADAVSAALTTGGLTGNWTTLLEVSVRSAAGVCIISDGCVPFATVKDILVPNSAESNE